MTTMEDTYNTYRFFIDSTAGTSRQAGQGHANFSVNIINHEKGGYKDCKVRLRKIFIPADSVEGVTGDTCLFLDCNFLKPNQYRSGFSSMTNSTLSTFSTRQNLQYTHQGTNIGVGQDIFLKADDDGVIIKGDSGNTVDFFAFQTIPKQKGLIGKVLSDDWIACENPFGKQLSFRIFDMDHLTEYNTGNNNGQRTIIEIEFQINP
jgi:hypothetical protein